MCKTMASRKRILCSLGNGPTKRNLFGPVDREQLQKEYQDALRKDLEEASQRWCFDFFSEKPMEGGDFQWEGVPVTKVPPLYRSCMVGLGQGGSQRATGNMLKPSGVRAGPSHSGKENVPRAHENYVTMLQKLEKTPEKTERQKLKRKQTNMKDFYQAKRRSVGTPRKSGQ